MAATTAPTRRRTSHAILALFGTVMLVGGTDLSKVTVALPELTGALSLGTTQTLWTGDVHPLAAGVALIPGAVAADRFGRRRVYLIGLVVAVVGAAAAGLAASGALLIAARVGQGVGSALLIAGTVAIIRVIFPDVGSRALAYGVWAAGFSTGSALGPLLGGALVEYGDWRWVFWVNVPVLLACLVAAVLVLPESTNPDPPSLDAVSAVLSASAVGLLVAGLKDLTQPDTAPWLAPAVIVAGALAALGFVVRQLRMPRPFLDVRLLGDGTLANAALVLAVTVGVLNGTLYLLTLRFQVVDGRTAIAAGVALLPLAVATAVGALLGPLLGRWFAQHLVVVAGLFAAASGFLTVATAPEAGALVGMASLGLGAGVIMAIGANVVMSAAPEERTADAGAIQESAFALGAGVGIAVLGVTAVRFAAASGAGTAPEAVHGVGTDGALGVAAVLYVFFGLAAGIHLIASSRGRRGGREPLANPV
ncbi:MFS transporter [Nocardiopsis eucommiae]|uniref:MFS transporter n=1 Tax=Nocardiopsis eucommiae TaxID=2831970 RepID=UPI003D7163C8